MRQMGTSPELRAKITASDATLVAMRMKMQQMDQQQELADLAQRMGALRSAIVPEAASADFEYVEPEFEPLEDVTVDALKLLT